MTEQFIKTWWSLAAVVAVGITLGAGLWGGMRAALGVATGGAWNLVSLWCLTQMLKAWLGPQPSVRRVLGWVLVKFPLLYVLAWVLMGVPVISPLWFGVGFTVVLAVIVVGYAQSARQLFVPPSHGR